MLKKYRWFAMPLFGGLLLGMIGCMSQVPYPVTYQMTTQKKMQAAEHWRVLAEDISKSIAARVDISKPLCVPREGKEPFNSLLADFLEQELVNKGYHVAVSGSKNSLPVLIKAKVLEHSDRYLRTPPGLMTALASGVWVVRDLVMYAPTGSAVAASIGGAVALDVAAGTYTGPLSKREVVVSVKIVESEQILLAENSIYYINESESWHYDNAPYTEGSSNNNSLNTKTMKVKGN